MVWQDEEVWMMNSTASSGNALHPLPLHYYLTTFEKLLIITTNYDELIETAFRERGRPFHVVVYKTGSPTFLFWKHGCQEPEEVVANEFDLAMNEATVIFKMHGAVDPQIPERDSYVITEDDYVEFLARMADKTAIPAVFSEPIKRRHFLFLGYGLRDSNCGSSCTRSGKTILDAMLPGLFSIKLNR